MKTRLAYIPLILILFTIPCFAACDYHEKDELQAILQLVISSQELNKYYHVDVFPERKPLRILRNKVIPESIELKLFDMEVKYITNKVNIPYIIFESIQEHDETVVVSFRYPPEGIHGEAFIKRANRNWIVEKIIIHEN